MDGIDYPVPLTSVPKFEKLLLISIMSFDMKTSKSSHYTYQLDRSFFMLIFCIWRARKSRTGAWFKISTGLWATLGSEKGTRIVDIVFKVLHLSMFWTIIFSSAQRKMHSTLHILEKVNTKN